MIMWMYSARSIRPSFSARVLGVVAADEFLLGLRQVERQAVALGEDGWS